MWMVFLDESGYTPDWQAGIEAQPFYALSAVCVPCSKLAASYQELREVVTALGVPDGPKPLGRGHEIKARDIASGSGWWATHTAERNGVRTLMLGYPSKAGGVAFIVVIDKTAHSTKYYSPDNPYLLAMKYILERVEHYLRDANDVGFLVYDHNKGFEPKLASETFSLLSEGSTGSFFSEVYEATFSFTLQLDHILELAFGDSIGSLGIQVADFFATFAYQHFKAGKPPKCGWWDTLVANLHRKDGVLDGVGLKVFP